MGPDFPDDLDSIQIEDVVARGVYSEDADEMPPTGHSKQAASVTRADGEMHAIVENPEAQITAVTSPRGSTAETLISADQVSVETERAVVAATRHVDRMRRRRERQAEASATWADRALDQALFCVIDLETTGTRPGLGDEILEVGAVQIVGLELGREFSTLVNPLRPISAASQAVHGIPDGAVMQAPRIGEVLPYVQELCRDRVLVFHNAGFDLGFLQRALAEAGRDSLSAPVVDTVVVARRLLGGRCGLGHASRRLGIDAPHPHRALPDARLTAMLLVRLVELLQRAGATRLGEIPGIVARPPRPRRRDGRPNRPLLARLEAAIDVEENLRIDYRASRGLVPLELLVRPLQLVGGLYLIAREVGTTRELSLELSRIDRVSAQI